MRCGSATCLFHILRSSQKFVSKGRGAAATPVATASFFGVIALALAAVGVYGVVSYTAATRRREIGIRIALGARARHVVHALLGRIAVVIAAGLLLGLALARTTGAASESLLYGVEWWEPRVLVTIVAVVACAALAAAALPARRALRADPVAALRVE
jgi:ABC-type antimicrobial peptide transport system permease subunit